MKRINRILARFIVKHYVKPSQGLRVSQSETDALTLVVTIAPEARLRLERAQKLARIFAVKTA